MVVLAHFEPGQSFLAFPLARLLVTAAQGGVDTIKKQMEGVEDEPNPQPDMFQGAELEWQLVLFCRVCFFMALTQIQSRFIAPFCLGMTFGRRCHWFCSAAVFHPRISGLQTQLANLRTDRPAHGGRSGRFMVPGLT